MVFRTGLLHLLLALTAPLVACRQPPRGVPSEDPADRASSASADRALTIPMNRQLGGCRTLTDAEPPEVLRVMSSGDRLILYANAQLGLAIVDATDPDEPMVVGVSELTGTPVGVFDLNGVAVLVYAPWDRPSATAIRAIEVGPHRTGRTIGEIMLPGAPRDARRVGDVIAVTWELPPEGTAPALTAVTTFMLDEHGLSRRDEHRLAGGGASVGGSPYGLAVAREASASLGPDRTSVTWLGIASDEQGLLRLHGTATVSGVVPRWRGAGDHLIDVAEDSRVRLIACATKGCGAGEAGAYASIDFAEPDRPRLTSWSLLARAGDGVFNFDGERLIVGRPAVDRSDTSELVVFDTTKDLVTVGSLRLRGSIGSISVPHSGDVVAVGWTGSASAGKRAILHHVDARSRPRLIGSTSFGGDWTWSPAYDDERALSFDPASTFAALPMTTLVGNGPARTAVQVFSMGRGNPTSVLESSVTIADRLLFVEGRLLAFSADGVTVVRPPGESVPQRRWDDVRTVR